MPHDMDTHDERPAHGTSPRRIGLISDTHGQVRTRVHQALAGVEILHHARDGGARNVLMLLDHLAPVRAVVANTDSPGDPQLSAEITLEIDGITIHESHGHEHGRPTPQALLERYPQDVLVYGHTHRQLVTQAGGRLVVNPGAAGPARFNLVPSVAILTLGDVPYAELVPLVGST